MQAIMETIFDIVYLTTVIGMGVWIWRHSQGEKIYRLFGGMAILLGFGDAFHLVPRAIALWSVGLEQYAVPLGFGKFVTSITMTVFYVCFYHIWCLRYEKPQKSSLTILVYILAIARIGLCFMPQNDWLSYNAPLSWGIYRNIPFVILGALMIWLYAKTAANKKQDSFRFIWFAIFLSFLFYIPVVLFADTIPIIGMLMIPKTLAYVWIVWTGYVALKHN